MTTASVPALGPVAPSLSFTIVPVFVLGVTGTGAVGVKGTGAGVESVEGKSVRLRALVEVVLIGVEPKI